MYDDPIFVLTGASSGLGLFLARRLLALRNAEVIAGVRSGRKTPGLQSIGGSGRLTVLPLDLSEMSSVAEFADDVIGHLGPQRRISTVFCNAGLQIVGPMRMTADGVEETFAVNHLGHCLLVDRLLPHIAAGGTVMSTASGTHDPDDRLATRFGFRGATFKDAAAVSLGDVGNDGSIVQLGMDRYATSKLCNILFVKAMARRIPPDRVRFIAFDPGLMPGTELARERPALMRFAWKHILPLLRGVVTGVSSPERSAEAMLRVALSSKEAHASGDYVEFTGRPAPRSSAAEDSRLAEDLLEVSATLTARVIAADL